MATKLKTIRIQGRDYFIDRRLREIRNVVDITDSESVSPEVLDYWEEHNITEL